MGYNYEDEKNRVFKTQQYFKDKDINCLYIRLGWNTGINSAENLQKNLIILFDYLLLKRFYPELYGFFLIGYPLKSKRILQYTKDWNLLCSPFFCNNKRFYLDYDSDDIELNSYNQKKFGIEPMLFMIIKLLQNYLVKKKIDFV